MLETPQKYETSFFADFADIQPSADTIPPLLDVFRDKNLLPSIFQQLGPAIPTVQNRLRLSPPDNEWVVDLETHRISIEKQPIKPRGANMGTPEQFISDAIAFLSRILQLFPHKGHRLSLVLSGLLPNMPAAQLDTTYERILVPLDFYTNNRPFEWKSRSGTRITDDLNGKQETFNVITRVDRIQGHFIIGTETTPFDRIQVSVDINTFQDNKEPRFEVSDARSFLPVALRIYGKVLSQLEARISV